MITSRHSQYAKKLFQYIKEKDCYTKCSCWGEKIPDYYITDEEVEEGTIEIYSNKDDKYLGSIAWMFYNDWYESIADYSLNLEDSIQLDTFINNITKNY